MRKLLFTTAALLACAGGASADTFVPYGSLGTLFDQTGAASLSLTPFVPPGNQPTNIPCVICGENQPQQPTNFGYTNFGNTGNQTDIRSFSSDVTPAGTGFNPGDNVIAALTQNYTEGAIASVLQSLGDLGVSFTIGVDVNDANGKPPQTLSQFALLDLTTQRVLAFLPNGVSVPSVNNGTGHPDYTLTGFDSVLNGVNPGDRLAFFSEITGATDGPDQFFLEPTLAVPGPTIGSGLPGVLAGLGGLAWLVRRRQERNNPLAI